jgi:hypothetical protein
MEQTPALRPYEVEDWPRPGASDAFGDLRVPLSALNAASPVLSFVAAGRRRLSRRRSGLLS